MKRGVAISLACVGGLLMAAHFLRHGSLPLVLLSLGFPWLLFVGRAWAVRTVQVLLVLGAGVWVHALVTIAARRQAQGQPWTRMAFILGGVALLTLVAAYAVRVCDRGPRGGDAGERST